MPVELWDLASVPGKPMGPLSPGQALYPTGVPLCAAWELLSPHRSRALARGRALPTGAVFGAASPGFAP